MNKYQKNANKMTQFVTSNLKNASTTFGEKSTGVLVGSGVQHTRKKNELTLTFQKEKSELSQESTIQAIQR